MRVGARGFSLIELLVAVAVLAMASVAALRSFDAAQRGIGGQAARLIAAEVALNRAAMLRLEGAEAGRALPPRVVMGGIAWTLETAQAETASGMIAVDITVSQAQGPGAALRAVVPRQGAAR